MMLLSYLRLALRNIAKNRLYALISIAGLAIGMTIYVFGHILVNYEQNHDHMFPKRDRIYLITSVFAPTSGEPISEFPGIRPVYGPLFSAELGQVDGVARVATHLHRFVMQDESFYESIRFVDPDFTRMFDFEYLHGEAAVVDDPNALILTQSIANKFFGHSDVVGQSIRLDGQLDMYVSAVIRDVAPDSHFNSDLRPNMELSVIANIRALENLRGESFDNEWSGYHNTYVLLPTDKDPEWLQEQVDSVFERHTALDNRDYIGSFKVREIQRVNSLVWDSLGFPVLEAVKLLGLLVLIVACVNYTNLATAQSFNRAREVGLRKTFGAHRMQLLAQFLFESLAIAAFAMMLALTCIEVLVPLYNDFSGKGVQLDYVQILPWLTMTTFLVGTLAGAYPAYLVSRLTPIQILRNSFLRGRKGNLFRSTMIAAQFAISIFILAMVMIIYLQNEKMRELGHAFPMDEVLVMEKMDEAEIATKHGLIRERFLAIDGVREVSFSDSVPFAPYGRWRDVTPQSGDETQQSNIKFVSVGEGFLSTYDIDVLAGRDFDKAFAKDLYTESTSEINVIINRLTADKMGFADDPIGKVFYQVQSEERPEPLAFTVVGLMPDQYFRGVHTDMSPMVFFVDPSKHKFMSVRFEPGALNQALASIDQQWRVLMPDYPIQHQFLDHYFRLFFRIPEAINKVFMAFAGVALSLALFGLFGLAAFMAQRRTKEIGIRKVMGASVSQIARLLIWQFSLPVIWSLLVAAPLAYLASSMYLDFFPERINFVVPVVLVASVIGVITAWAIVAGHAIGIAKATPIRSLRYE